VQNERNSNSNGDDKDKLKARKAVDDVVKSGEGAKNAASELHDTSDKTYETLEEVEQKVFKNEKRLDKELQSKKGSTLKIGGHKLSDIATALVKPPEPDLGPEPELDPELVKKYKSTKNERKKITKAKKEVKSARNDSLKFKEQEKKRKEKMDDIF
jgi:hypothetical protein